LISNFWSWRIVTIRRLDEKEPKLDQEGRGRLSSLRALVFANFKALKVHNHVQKYNKILIIIRFLQ